MTLETWFGLFNTLALVGWLLLAVFPRHPRTAPLVTSVLIPALLGVAYLVLLGLHFAGPNPQGDFSSLQGVTRLFADRRALLAGWIHYLAFDLFIGSWQVRDAGRAGIPHLLVLPCLAVTFLFGPVGLLCYFAVRRLRGEPASLSA